MCRIVHRLRGALRKIGNVARRRSIVLHPSRSRLHEEQAIILDSYKELERQAVAGGGKPFVQEALTGAHAKQFEPMMLRAVRTQLIGALAGATGFKIAGPGGAAIAALSGVTASTPRGVGWLLRKGEQAAPIVRVVGKAANVGVRVGGAEAMRRKFIDRE